MKNRLLLLFGFLLLLPLSTTAQSLQLADSLFQKGRQYDQSGQIKQSEFYYRESYNIYRDFKDTTSWLKAGKEYASAMMWRSKNDEAITLYKKLLEVDHPDNDPYNRGDLYNSMGLASKRKGAFDSALQYYQRSLPLAKQSGDSLLIGVVYNNLGGINRATGNLSEALSFYRKSLPFFQSSDRQRNKATTLGNIGTIYRELSLHDKALEYFNRSLTIRKKHDNVFSFTKSYNQIGGIQRELGNYDQALISFKKSLEYAQKAGTPRYISSSLNNLGLLYKTLGEYDKALDYYRQSLAIKKDISDPSGIATTTNNLGQLMWAQDKKEKAEKYFRKALEVRKQIGNPYDIYYSLNTMLRLTVNRQHFKQARSYARQLQTIGDSTGSYEMLQKASTYIGKIEDAQNNDQLALEHFKKAYAYSQYLPPTKQLSPLKNLAHHYHKLHSDSALFYGQKAIDIIEQHRSRAGAVSELKSGYFGKHATFYNQMASWMLKYNSDVAGAYRLVEQSKARSLSDELVKASQNIEQKLPEEVRIKRQKRRRHIDELYSRLERIANNEKRAHIRENIRTAELDLAAYENQIHREYPELKSLKSPAPISLERAQEITDEQTAVLEYALADNQLIIFLISRDDVHVKQYSLPNDKKLANELTRWVADFKDAILSNSSRSALRSKSERLYKVLLKPFESYLDKYKNLVVIPDGALAYLPFEAISQGDQYLIENFRIKYEPSLTSLTLLGEPDPVDQKELLAVAGSQVSEANNPSYRSPSLSALPSTIIEVDSIASHFQQVSTLKNDQVSEKAFKQLLQKNKYRYIHLATHGVIDENEPHRSGLALSAEGNLTASSKEDGMLRSSEIFGLNIDSDMVVLSACNTGLGKVVGGEGILGLQRSFFYAGTSTVVVSLWNVYDRSTASFMNEFYKALHDDVLSESSWFKSTLRWIGWDDSIPFGPKATAMRQAKLTMIKHPLFNHPVYWAPFIVVGR